VARRANETPAESGGPALAHASIEREAAPLMSHVLGVYCRLRHGAGDAALRRLRGRGWSFEDLAAVCSMAERSGRSLEEMAQACESRGDWRAVARERNIALAPDDPRRLLRLAVERYCALGAGTAGDLEERGWTLGDILVAGNLFFLSDTGFWEIVQQRGARREWSTIARAIGVSPDQIYQPIHRRPAIAGAP
jgi:hypothetical protein